MKQAAYHETMLHVAASYCDVELVSYLLDKGQSSDSFPHLYQFQISIGADLTALNGANLMPFHVSIMYGNEPVVQFFLARRGKASDGCHPSKAAPDGRTPLDLAIVSGSFSLIQLMVKDATVHNVQRCWERSPSDQIKDILETKVFSFHLLMAE
jgi:ankyrin repeat protein